MRRSEYKNTLSVPTLTITARTNGTVNGTTVDRFQTSGTRGDYRGGVLFVLVAGTVTDGTHAFTLQDSDDGSAWATAAASDTQGSLANLVAAGSNTVSEIGYCGLRRYVRLSVTTSGATTGGIYGAVAVLSGSAVQR